MLTRGDIETDFLFGKERSDGDPCPWLSFTLFPLAKIPASVRLLLRFLTARRSGPDPEACRDRAYIRMYNIRAINNILVYDKNNVKSYQSFGTWRKVCFFENLSNLSDEVKKQLTSCASLL